MNYRKGLAKKSYVTRFVLAHQAILSHFHPCWPTFLQYPALNWPTTYNEHFTAYNIITFACLLTLVDCTRCSEYFVQPFEPWIWLVCMLACVRLCVTSQLSRATLIIFKAGPLDLSFCSFFTFLHHGIEEVKRHLLWKFYKKFEGKVGQMCHRSCSLP